MKPKTRNSLLAICLSLVFIAGVTVAAAPAIEVGEVRSPPTKGALVAKHFRNTVLESIAELDTAQIKGGPFLVSASLVKLNGNTTELGVQATALVRTVLIHKKTGSMIGMTEGQATAHAPGGSLSDAQHSALRAAMQSALKDVSAALSGR
jgi:hypothetical protein